MNVIQRINEWAKPLLRPLPGPLRAMSDDELHAAKAAHEELKSDGMRLLAKAQPALEMAAAESYAYGEPARVGENAAAVREAKQKLEDVEMALAGFNTEIERRAAEALIAGAEQRRKDAEAAAVAFAEEAVRFDATTADFVRAYHALHTARENVYRTLPEKTRRDFFPEALRRDFIDGRINAMLCGGTDGELVKVKGIFSATELRKHPGMGAFLAQLPGMLERLNFNGAG